MRGHAARRNADHQDHRLRRDSGALMFRIYRNVWKMASQWAPHLDQIENVIFSFSTKPSTLRTNEPNTRNYWFSYLTWSRAFRLNPVWDYLCLFSVPFYFFIRSNRSFKVLKLPILWILACLSNWQKLSWTEKLRAAENFKDHPKIWVQNPFHPL